MCPDSPCCARALVVRGRGDGPSGANSNRYVPSNSFARIVAAWAEPSGSAGSTSTHRIQQVSKPWIIRFQSLPDARVRLFCLPHAGVGASAYRTWHTGLGPEVEVCAVQPPGRESRFREPPYRRLVDLADAVADAIAPETDRPYALFGHSMGAWVAFEVARRLDGRRAGPACLIVSGRRSPQSEAEAPPIHQLPDDAFIEELMQRFGGIPDAILRDRSVLDLFLPTLRADMEAVETYEYVPGSVLSCPVWAVAGARDPWVSRATLEAWRVETTGRFEVRTFPGGHFYLVEAQGELLALITQALRETVRDPRRERARV